MAWHGMAVTYCPSLSGSTGAIAVELLPQGLCGLLTSLVKMARVSLREVGWLFCVCGGVIIVSSCKVI